MNISIKEIFVSVVLGIVVISCANMATPSGGTYDLDPPKLVHTTPHMNETNFKGNKIQLFFDENVTVQEPSEKVIVTPPQKLTPKIFGANKKVEVQLRDSLIPNTTYIVDFTDAIVDNNEGNSLENFSIAFSTGETIDSLAVSGRVLSASDLEPMKGVYVGLHSNLSDTAFTHIPFERISKSNENGYFTIRGVAPGKYKIYALADVTREYKYTNPSSAVAFFDSIIVPSATGASRMDTTFIEVKHRNSSLPERIVDTVKQVGYTRFLPDDILLKTFLSDFQRKFLQKYERVDNRLVFYFGTAMPMPGVYPLNFKDSANWAIVERKAQNDTITYWLNSTSVMAMDTILLEVDYLKTDSLNHDVLMKDTLSFMLRGKKNVKKKMKKIKNENGDEIEVEDIDFLDIKMNLGEQFNPNSVVRIEFSEPIRDIDSLSSKIRLEQAMDSSQVLISYSLQQDSLNPRKYSLTHKWDYGGVYKLTIDSANIFSIYGHWNKDINLSLTVKPEDEFSKLAFVISGLEGPAFVELLDKSDTPVRQTTVRNNIALFRDVVPGTYFARIIMDTNNNGKWDTGDFYTKRQPETVLYYEGGLELKANFEIEQPWMLAQPGLANQKPMEVMKNKPKEKTSKRKQLEEEERKRKEGDKKQNNQSSPYGQNSSSSTGTLGR